MKSAANPPGFCIPFSMSCRFWVLRRDVEHWTPPKQWDHYIFEVHREDINLGSETGTIPYMLHALLSILVIIVDRPIVCYRVFRKQYGVLYGWIYQNINCLYQIKLYFKSSSGQERSTVINSSRLNHPFQQVIHSPSKKLIIKYHENFHTVNIIAAIVFSNESIINRDT